MDISLGPTICQLYQWRSMVPLTNPHKVPILVVQAAQFNVEIEIGDVLFYDP